MAKRKSSTKSSRISSAGASASVRGAVPYQPKMSTAHARSAVNTFIGERITLAKYRPTIQPLSTEERELLIQQAIVMLDQIYAHLPLKRSLHANDPIQSLRLLRLRQATLDERAFQSALGICTRTIFFPAYTLESLHSYPSESRNSTTRAVLPQLAYRKCASTSCHGYHQLIRPKPSRRE